MLLQVWFHFPENFFLVIIFLAILVCLEHSFWLTHQGSSPFEGFTEAFNIYLKDKHALLGQKLKAYLMSKKSNDWFIMKFCPSQNELADLRNIVLDNLLCKTSSCLFSLVLLIQSLQLILNPPIDVGSCSLTVFLVKFKGLLLFAELLLLIWNKYPANVKLDDYTCIS